MAWTSPAARSLLRSIELDTFFRPKRVAVVGASDTNARPNTSITQKITVWAEERGATVYFVNPNRDVVGGRPCVKALSDIVEPLDLVAILVGEPLPILRDAVAARAKFAVVFAAGFAEVGKKGEHLQDEMERIIASSDLHLLGPNTNLNAFEVFREDLPGRAIALITQSGHQGRPIFQGQEIGIKLSHWAPTGNEVDLESADFINYFSSLPTTGAVACYIEGFKDGRTLQLAADAAARRGVPIVAVKVGRTDEGASMARAHTGHLTGSDNVVSAVFRQYGVQRVDGLDQLLDVSAALARTKPPAPATLSRLTRGAGARCVYSISGGTGAHMADLAAAAGLELPSLTKASQTQLHEWIPPYLRVSNPVDNGGAPVRDWRGPKIIETMLADPNVDLLLCPVAGAVPSMADKLSEDLVAAAETTDKPIFVVWGSPVGTEEAYTKTLLESTVPTFRTFSNAVMASRAYFDHHRFAASYRSAFTRPVLRPTPGKPHALSLLAPGANGPRRSGEALSERDSKAMLAAYGVATPKERIATSPSEAAKAAKKIGFPAVMKIASADILHKSDLGLVAVGIRDEDDARRTYKRLVATAKKAAPTATVDGVLVAQMVPGIETVVGIARDDLFGPVVMFGLGGVLVEVLRDVTFRVPPFTARDAAAMLGEPRGAAMLRGVRGRPAADQAALVDVLMKMQRLAVDLASEVVELDINPLLAGPKGAVAADALVVLA